MFDQSKMTNWIPSAAPAIETHANGPGEKHEVIGQHGRGISPSSSESESEEFKNRHQVEGLPIHTGPGKLREVTLHLFLDSTATHMLIFIANIIEIEK